MGPDEHVRGLQLLERLMRMRSRLCRELDQQLRTLLGMPGVLEVTEDAQEAGAAGHSGQAAVPRMLPAPPKVSRAQVEPLKNACVPSSSLSKSADRVTLCACLL